jgi:hypothetical protein
MNASPPTGPVATLPILATTGAAFRSVLLDNIRHFPRAALAPVLISLLLLLVQVRFGLLPDPEATPGPGEPGLGGLPEPSFGRVLISLAGVVPYVVFAVAWHRLILLGPAAGQPSWLPSWRGRHWRFLGYMLAIGVIVFGAAMVLALGGSLLGGLLFGALSGGEAAAPGPGTRLAVLLVSLVFMVAIGWLLARLSFVLPARAVDERYGLRDSWNQTRGQGLRLLATFLLVQLLVAIPSLLVVGLLGTGGGVVGAINQMPSAHFLEAAVLFVGVLPLLLFGFLASYLSTALGVTVLSIAFRTCSGWTAGAAPGPPQ